MQGSDHRNAAASLRRLTTAGSAAGSASAAVKPRSARSARRGHHGLAQGRMQRKRAALLLRNALHPLPRPSCACPHPRATPSTGLLNPRSSTARDLRWRLGACG
ncbi:hypothetical protein FHT15_000615 [Xanthomonas campestris]